jgi:hypothetical protein
MRTNPLEVDLNYYRGIRYNPLRIVFDDAPKYSQLYVRVTFNNSAGFFLKSIQGVYFQTQIFGEQYNVCRGDLSSSKKENLIINSGNDFTQEISCKTCQW